VDTISDTLAIASSFDFAAFFHNYTYRAAGFLKMDREVLPTRSYQRIRVQTQNMDNEDLSQVDVDKARGFYAEPDT